VLDLGTGTGIWAIDVADLYPSAVVIGTDLSPIQPSWVPPNIRFEIEDFSDDWTFKLNDFDYIHLGCLSGSVGNWPRLYKQAYK
jgi:cyclopropane fatty-acyl-phospholipid synthase-like methyltransferase